MGGFLVTGANGFVGRHLVAALEARERSARSWRRFPDASAQESGARGVSVVGAGHGTERSVDFRMADDVAALVRDVRPSHVVHLAGTSTLAELLRDPQHGNYNVVQPAVNLMEALATAAPGARLVLVSPCEVYGRASRLPIDERSPLAPVDLYAAARAAVEYMARAYGPRGVPVVVARVFHCTGPGQDKRSPLGDAAAQAARGGPVRIGDPEARRDIVDVRDVADGLVLLAERGVAGEAYNLCSGAARSMRALVEQIAGPGVPVEHDPARDRPGAVPVYLGSAAKAEALGWARRWGIGETLRDLSASHR